MTMITPRLTIRRTSASDWLDLLDLWTDLAASPYAQYDMPHPTDPDLVKARVARWAATAESADHRFYSVLLDGRVIGYASCHQHGDGFELGYAFHSACHGQGYATESIGALVEALLCEGAAFIEAGTALNNTPSVKLLGRLGFQQVGTEDVSFYKDDAGRDIVFTGGQFMLTPSKE